MPVVSGTCRGAYGSGLLTTTTIPISTVLMPRSASFVVGTGATTPITVASRSGSGSRLAAASTISGCGFPDHLTDCPLTLDPHPLPARRSRAALQRHKTKKLCATDAVVYLIDVLSRDDQLDCFSEGLLDTM